MFLRCSSSFSKHMPCRLQLSVLNLLRPCHGRLQSTFVPTRYPVIHRDILIEEETLPGYKAHDYYPVKIGETFLERYQTLAKLGYGAASTVWLCRDAKGPRDSRLQHHELGVYEHLNSVSDNYETHHIRNLVDSFEIDGPDGKHLCLVMKPNGESLGDLRRRFDKKQLPVGLIRQLLRSVLEVIKFLHEDARIIHTDLKPDNLLLSIHDESILAKFEQGEIETPIARKELEDRTIYVSGTMALACGLPDITDFSEARFGDTQQYGHIMPDLYRASEVILEMPSSFPVDFWGFAMTFWHLIEGQPMFQPYDTNGEYREDEHLVQITAVLGPPPLDLLP